MHKDLPKMTLGKSHGGSKGAGVIGATLLPGEVAPDQPEQEALGVASAVFATDRYMARPMGSG